MRRLLCQPRAGGPACVSSSDTPAARGCLPPEGFAVMTFCPLPVSVAQTWRQPPEEDVGVYFWAYGLTLSLQLAKCLQRRPCTRPHTLQRAP